MKHILLVPIILILGFYCYPAMQLFKPDSVGMEKSCLQNTKLIRFDFTAEREQGMGIKINASLFNNNADTVYFLSSTCDGDQYLLQYDTAKFVLTPFMNCNASYPRLAKIAPGSQYDFGAYFASKEPKIKLGVDLYLVDRSFNMEQMSLAGIYHRKDKYVIWSEEKTIK